VYTKSMLFSVYARPHKEWRSIRVWPPHATHTCTMVLGDSRVKGGDLNQPRQIAKGDAGLSETRKREQNYFSGKAPNLRLRFAIEMRYHFIISTADK
jgi:hypothetical protein